MNALGDGLWGYLVLLMIALLVHEPWRWAGYAVGRTLNPDDEIFKRVKAVSTALVAALVMRLLLFPSGALLEIPLALRLGGSACGIAAYYAGGQVPWVGVVAGAIVIAVGKLVIG